MNALVGLLCLCLGMVLGRWLERRSWLIRGDGDTAHHAGGKFWYIVSEDRIGSPTALPDRCKACDKILPSRWQSHYCSECRDSIDRECGKER